MTSIETYHARIDALKTKIETSKGSRETILIRNLPGRDDIVVREFGDTDLPWGTVIAGSGGHVYLRVPHGRIYWVSSAWLGEEPTVHDLKYFYDHLCKLAAGGEQFRIVYQPDEQKGAYAHE